jgi:TP901 family phage tail tape measure protein
MPGRTTSVAFLGNDADLNRVADRVAAKLRATTAVAEETNAKSAASAEVAGRKFGDAFEHGTSRAGNALSKLGSTASSWGVPFAGSLEKVGAKLDAATSKSQKFSTAVAEAGKLTLVAGATGFAAAGAAAVKFGEQFQTATASIEANLGVTAAAAKKITDAFSNMGGKTEYSGQQLEQSFAAVSGQLKLTEGHALSAAEATKLMGAASDLATAKQMNLGDATAAVANVMQAYHLGVNQAAGAANVLFNTSKSTGTGVGQVAQAADRLHARLGTLAPSLGQTATVMVAMAQHGLTGGRALLSVNTAFQAMANPSAKADQILKTLGVSLYDAQGHFIGLQGVITQLGPKFAQLTPQQQNFAAATLFGKQANQAMIGILRDGVPAYQQAAATVTKHNAVQAAAAAQSHTLRGQFETLKGTVETLGGKFGLFLIPKLEAVGHAVSDVIGWFGRHKTAAEVLAGTITSVLGLAITVFAYTKAVAFVKATKDMVTGIGKVASTVVGVVPTILAKLGLIGSSAAATATEVGTADSAIEGSNAAAGASFAAMAAEADAGALGVEGSVATMATDVATADTAIEASNAAAGASFKALLGPIALAVAAIEGYNALATNYGAQGTAAVSGLQHASHGALSQKQLSGLLASTGAIGSATEGKHGAWPWTPDNISLINQADKALKSFAGSGNASLLDTIISKAQTLRKEWPQDASSLNTLIALMDKAKHEGASSAVSSFGGAQVVAGQPGGATGRGGVWLGSGGKVTTSSFAASVLSRLGAPTNAANIDALVGWIQREGNNPSIDKFNPLDTTKAEPGARSTNSVGVKSYTSWAQGLAATVATLQQSNFAAIVAALKAGQGLSGPGIAAELSSWSGGGYSSTAPGSVGNAAIQKLIDLNSGKTKAAKGVRSLLYADPLHGDQYTVERTDQGKDYGNIKGNIGAIGTGVVTLAQSLQGFGQTIVEKLTQGPNKGQYVYYGYETGATGVGIRQGQTVHAGQTIGRGLGTGGVEFGYWNPKTGKSEGYPYFSGANATPPGEAFAKWMAQLSHGGTYVTTKGGVTTGGGTNYGYTVSQLEQAFTKALVTSGNSLLTKLNNAIQSGTVRTLGNVLGASTGGKTGAQLNRSIEALGGTATLGQITGPGPADTAGFAKLLTGDLGKIHAAALTQLDHDLGAKHGTALATLVTSLTGLHGKALTQIESKLTASHSKPMQQLGKDLKAGPASLPSLESILSKSVDASQQGRAFNSQVAALVAVGQTTLAARLVAAHRAAIATLAQEMYAEQVLKDGESLNLQATQLRDLTSLQQNADAAQLNVLKASDQKQLDAMTAQVTVIRDMTQVITDQFAAMTQSVEDSMQQMADAASSTVTGINDQTQTRVDILGERGLYGLNLIAQRLQVQADETKSFWDQQIAQGQLNLDVVTAQWHTAVQSAQLNLDQVTLQEDQLLASSQQADDTTKIEQTSRIAAAQQHADAVTLHFDSAVVGPAQIAVDLGATLPKAQQDVFAAQLRRAEGQAGVAEGQAGATLEAVTASANAAMENADHAYQQAQQTAQLIIGNANQTLAAVTGEANVAIDTAKSGLQSTQDAANIAEAGADSAAAIMKQTASTQFAGTGVNINIYGIPANDAAAIGDEVQWAARALIPAF